MALVEKDAAMLVTDDAAIEQLGDSIVNLLRDDQRRQTMARNIKGMALPDAAPKIVSDILAQIHRQ
jgi:UDP-N-acetylglucosamine--N-acetylmuramyl-(pentapeptide) pyrophosphoryl-undecaprenol N-acetylglucosamine transferase